MILINIAALLVAVAVVVLVIALIPLIRELKATSIALRETVVRLDTDIQPTIRELQTALADLNVITTGAAEKVEDVKCFMSAVGDTGRGLHTISTVVSGAATALSNSALWLTGAKVAGSYLLEKLTKKRG
jgi:uncharacterized protein YoxC